jgi:uncharacterized protein (TIGR03546 family)
LLRLVARFIRLLGSETDPAQIALGVALALIAGLTPVASLHNLVVLFLLLVLRANLSAFLLSWAVFSGLAYLLDPVFHAVGLWLLTLPALQGFWTFLYNVPGMRLTRFHHTITLGSVVLSVLLVVPVFVLAKAVVRRYREQFLARVRALKIAQVLKASRLYRALRAAWEVGEGR